jgi:DtxR family transcriptional regulator, Mn-dependent transcriptional regulator
MYTVAEESYLKVIFKIAEKEKKAVSTNAIAQMMGTTAASATDMIKKLSQKELITYEKYYGVHLSPLGNKIATHLIRRHRLWEQFLAQKLRFAWHQIHDIAELLEHIDSEELIQRLDAFLDYPKYDPHGDPIPNADGKFTIRNQILLTDINETQSCQVIAVRDQQSEFLKYLTKLNIKIGSDIKVLHIVSYDKSLKIYVDNKHEHTISKIVSQNILVRKT